MKIPDQILEEIHQIKKQYEVDASGLHQRWPNSLRSRAEALLKSGVSPKELSEATGVGARTLYYWRRTLKTKSFQEISVMACEAKITAAPNKISSNLESSVKKHKVHDPIAGHPLTVNTPDGFSVTVGSCAEAVEFVMGCRRAGLCS